MTILEALRDSNNSVRLSTGSKWLVFDEIYFVVYERKSGQRKSKIICQTIYETEAVKYLLGEENN